MNSHCGTKENPCIGWCPCGMPFYDDDTIFLIPIDEWEARVMTRCQHCGYEGGRYMQLICQEPAYNARFIL